MMTYCLLQKRMDELGKMLSKLCVGICVLMLVIALIQGRDVFEMLLTAISLAVAAIPGLAAIVAIVLAYTWCYQDVQNQCNS